MKLINFLLVPFFICASTMSIAEELNLNCVGTLETTQVATNQKRNSQAQASIRIDLETNNFAIDGFPIMSTTLDTNVIALRFLTSDNSFEFGHEFKNSTVYVLSRIKINRYSGRLEIYEAMLNSNGPFIVSSNMDCTNVTKKKF